MLEKVIKSKRNPNQLILKFEYEGEGGKYAAEISDKLTEFYNGRLNRFIPMEDGIRETLTDQNTGISSRVLEWNMDWKYKGPTKHDPDKDAWLSTLFIQYYFSSEISPKNRVVAYFNMRELDTYKYEEGKVKTLCLDVGSRKKSNDGKYQLANTDLQFQFDLESSKYETEQVYQFLMSEFNNKINKPKPRTKQP